jgi:hypothetical protein
MYFKYLLPSTPGPVPRFFWRRCHHSRKARLGVIITERVGEEPIVENRCPTTHVLSGRDATRLAQLGVSQPPIPIPHPRRSHVKVYLWENKVRVRVRSPMHAVDRPAFFFTQRDTRRGSDRHAARRVPASGLYQFQLRSTPTPAMPI